MPRSFEVSFESPATVEEVHAAFGNRDYWLDRLAAFGGAKSLDSLESRPPRRGDDNRQRGFAARCPARNPRQAVPR